MELYLTGYNTRGYRVNRTERRIRVVQEFSIYNNKTSNIGNHSTGNDTDTYDRRRNGRKDERDTVLKHNGGAESGRFIPDTKSVLSKHDYGGDVSRLKTILLLGAIRRRQSFRNLFSYAKTRAVRVKQRRAFTTALLNTAFTIAGAPTNATPRVFAAEVCIRTSHTFVLQLPGIRAMPRNRYTRPHVCRVLSKLNITHGRSPRGRITHIAIIYAP